MAKKPKRAKGATMTKRQKGRRDLKGKRAKRTKRQKDRKGSNGRGEGLGLNGAP